MGKKHSAVGKIFHNEKETHPANNCFWKENTPTEFQDGSKGCHRSLREFSHKTVQTRKAKKAKHAFSQRIVCSRIYLNAIAPGIYG